MKKTFKIIIGVVVIIGFIVVTLIILLPKKKNIEVLTIPYDYVVVASSTDNTIDIPVFVSEKDSSYLKEENISKVYLHNQEEEFKVNLNSINQEDSYDYNNESYYLYEVLLDLPEASNFQIEEAYLKLCYDSYPDLNLHIGSLAIVNENPDNNLSYGALKGITKKVGDLTILEGVIVSLHGINSYTIKKITPLNFNVKVDALSKEISGISSLIDEMPQDYQILKDGTTSDFDIFMKEDDYVLILLNYEEYLEVPSIGFIIDYEMNGQSFQKVIKPFQFYSLSSNDLKVETTIYEPGN